MSSCFQTVFCCWKSTSNRLFYQNNNDSDERGIEYDRLIELPEVDDRSTGRTPAPKLVLNERERHLISNRLYSEYADDQERFNRLADEELHKDEERLAMQEEELYAQRTSKIREFYQNRPPSTSLGETQNFADFSQSDNDNSFKRISALEEEEDYEKFLEIVKNENSLTDVVLYNNNKYLDLEDELDYDLDLENYADDEI
ncbi:uncharacterized protein LOC134824095 isoform X2 [Bolinopsis microptera]|uniref:uncharacterized protein LOC134824095 isoform X2 n=1 Tax=Bolinopsis microptera TaxID=2820187 RepID=UPI0030792492